MPALVASPHAPTRVATLLGAAQLDHALLCLESLLRWSVDPIRLVIHDDGTLSPQQAARLTTRLPGASVLSRPVADERVAPLLALYPHLEALRRANPLYLKLLDARLLTRGQLAYIDADILFLRQFHGLFALPGWANAAFMRDRQHAYSLRSWRALLSGVHLAARINTGVVLFQEPLDLDALEWLVTRPGFGHPPAWAEQTAWAFLAMKGRSAYLDPTQLTFPGNECAETVGLHFITPLRPQLHAYPLGRETPAGQPAGIRFSPVESASSISLLAAELERRLRRQLHCLHRPRPPSERGHPRDQ